MTGALIVTAELAPSDFAWLEGFRRAHYPAERNRVPAHLTLFHALPPSILDEAKRQLALHSAGTPVKAAVAGLMDLGGGVAFRIVSDGLDEIRESLADHFHGSLGSQDAVGWRPHITIQNKVPTRHARELIVELGRSFHPRPLKISGLALHRYRGGLWKTVCNFPFRGA